jgi:excisionase family DNA binding protein
MGSMNVHVPFRDRISCTIDEACHGTGLGRSKLYEEIAAGRVRTAKVGRRVLVLVESLKRLVAPDEAAADASGGSDSGDLHHGQSECAA